MVLPCDLLHTATDAASGARGFEHDVVSRIRPILLPVISVNHIVPSGPAAMLMGRISARVAYSVIVCAMTSVSVASAAIALKLNSNARVRAGLSDRHSA